MDAYCSTNTCTTSSRGIAINDIYTPPHRRTEEIALQRTKHREQMTIKTTIMLYDTHQHHTDVITLIDSGCTTSAIDEVLSFGIKSRLPLLLTPCQYTMRMGHGI